MKAGKGYFQFCQEYTLVIAKTLFQQNKRRLYTWTLPDGQYWNQTDYIPCSQRWRRRQWHPTPVLLPENHMDGGAWKAAVHGVAEGWTRLSDFTLTFYFRALEKEMATHSSVLAWRIPGTGEPGRLPSMGLHRVGHDWSDLAAAAAANEKCTHFTMCRVFLLSSPMLLEVTWEREGMVSSTQEI